MPTPSPFKKVIPPVRLVRVALVAALGLAAAIGPAHAVDIGFGPIDVNVQGFANSDLKRIEVDCLVYDANGAYLPVDSYTILPAYPGLVKLDAAGGFVGKVGAGLFLKNPADVANAKSFKCELRGDDGSTLRNLEIGNGTEWWHVKSGVLSVSGPIN
ncbi:MAG: hypothetical protein KIT48_17110 [Pseudolabrys sp.]|nr:hypothetical protein [Pseudolabrys sp.]